MKQKTINKLKADYLTLNIRTQSSVIKYYYQFNTVNVNIYFDNFDKKIPNLSIILVKNKDYYYSSLNILSPNINVQYLEDIPSNILKDLLDKNDSLDTFFQDMEDHLLKDKHFNTSYNHDKLFKNTMKYTVRNNKKRKDLPFLKGCRHVYMSDKMYNLLQMTFGLDKSELDKIRNANITLVRTSNVAERKQITIVLKNEEIKL